MILRWTISGVKLPIQNDISAKNLHLQLHFLLFTGLVLAQYGTGRKRKLLQRQGFFFPYRKQAEKLHKHFEFMKVFDGSS